MDHYQRKFQQRLQKQLYNDSIEQVTKIVAPVANKAEESMQHLQEYSNTTSISTMGIQQRLSTTAKSSVLALRKACYFLKSKYYEEVI